MPTQRSGFRLIHTLVSILELQPALARQKPLAYCTYCPIRTRGPSDSEAAGLITCVWPLQKINVEQAYLHCISALRLAQLGLEIPFYLPTS